MPTASSTTGMAKTAILRLQVASFDTRTSTYSLRRIMRRGSCSFGRGRQTVIAELLAKRGFQDFPGRRVGNLVHENHVVGRPPFGDLAAQEFEHLGFAELLVLFQHD